MNLCKSRTDSPCYACVNQGYSRRKGKQGSHPPCKHCSLMQSPSCCWCPEDATCVLTAVLLNEWLLLHWFNKGHIPLFYSGVIRLHRRKVELSFGLSSSQPNPLESSNPMRCVESTVVAMCHQGWVTAAAAFTHTSIGTGVVMALNNPPGFLQILAPSFVQLDLFCWEYAINRVKIPSTCFLGTRCFLLPAVFPAKRGANWNCKCLHYSCKGERNHYFSVLSSNSLRSRGLLGVADHWG